MNSRKLAVLSLFAMLLVLLPGLVQAQNDLPSAPTPVASKPSNPFVLPAATPHTPPAPDASTSAPPLICGAPATGIYGQQHSDTAEQKREIWDYNNLIYASVSQEWHRRMPRSANDPWAKGKFVQVRFAIMPDGSYDPAIVTMSSGRSSWDAHATSAVNSYANFPLPPKVGHPLIFCFKFGYDTDGSLNKAKTPDLWPPPAKSSNAPSSSH